MSGDLIFYIGMWVNIIPIFLYAIFDTKETYYYDNIKKYKRTNDIYKVFVFYSFTIINLTNLISTVIPVENPVLKWIQFFITFVIFILFFKDYIFDKVKSHKYIMHLQLNVLKGSKLYKLFDVKEIYALYAVLPGDRYAQVSVIKQENHYSLQMKYYSHNYLLKPFKHMSKEQLIVCAEYINHNLYFLSNVNDLYDLYIPHFDHDTSTKFRKQIIYSKNIFTILSERVRFINSIKRFAIKFGSYLGLLIVILSMYVIFKQLIQETEWSYIFSENFWKWIIDFK